MSKGKVLLGKLPMLASADGGDSIPDRIAASIREAIFLGSIGGGVQLKQNDVADELGVSPAPVREALKKLTSEGLLVNERNKGVTVAPLSLPDFKEITDLRLMLEPYLLRCSAPKLTSSLLDAAEATLANEDGNESPVAHARRHWDFHRTLYCRADRPRTQAQVDVLYVSISRYLLPAWTSSGLSDDWEHSHLDIVSSLRKGNVDNAAAMIQGQIERASARVIKFFV